MTTAVAGPPPPEGPPAEVLDGLDVMICGLDEHGTILVFNGPCERMTGIARERALGASWLDVFSIGPRRDDVMALWREAAAGRASGPFEAIDAVGRFTRWQFSRPTTPSSPLALWAVGFDITADRAALQRARQLERLRAIGNLIAGLAHELRNPLNGAALQLTVASRALDRRRDPTLAPTHEAVDHARGEVQRIAALLEDFLTFARPAPLDVEPVDLRELLAAAIARTRGAAAHHDVTVISEPAASAIVGADPARVQEALHHLLSNAIDAAAHSTDRIVVARVLARPNAVAVEIEDHGPGLPSGDAPVFEPFFTTKPGGTGLGLAIVERVATDHGGSIVIERVDASTLCRLTLPVAGLPVAGPPVATEPAS